MTDLEIAKIGNTIFNNCDRLMEFISSEHKNYVREIVEKIKNATLILEQESFKEDK